MPVGDKFRLKVKLDTRYRYVLAVGGIGGVVVLLLLLLAVRPLAGRFLADSRSVSEKSAQVALLDQKIQDLGVLQGNYARLGESDRNKVLVALPPDTDVSHLLAVVDIVATRTSVRVASVTPGDAAGGQESTSKVAAAALPFSVVVQGGYAQILAFMAALERAPRLIDISSVAFTGFDPISATVSGQAYYQPGEKK